MNIKRARGHRLYTHDGKKILDLSMDWGRAVIGHRPNGLSLTIKNIIDRGIYCAYNSSEKDRLTKYLQKKFPQYRYVSYLHTEDRLNEIVNHKIIDPLFSNTGDNKISYWRPFLETPNSEYLVVLYPLPGLNTTTVLLSKNNPNIIDDAISPILFAGILRSLYDYEMEYKKFKSDLYVKYKDIPEAKFQPPYMTFDLEIEQYKKIVEKATEYGILLNNKEQIIVLPPDYSDGELKKVLNFFKESL